MEPCPRLRHATIITATQPPSVTVAQITVGFFALDRLHLDPAGAASAAGIALAIVGVALVCAQLALSRLGWMPEQLIRVGSVLSALGFASVVLASSPPMLWGSYALAAFGMGWVYPSVSALAANSVEAHEQGAAAGSVAAAQGFGIVVGPIVGTGLYGLDNGLPYAVIAFVLLFTALRRPHGCGEGNCGSG